ncbi:MAG: hypothetical protein GKR89_11405 [Candidatus Latescibacteria bacterium]|nr:hypothetical protein [Candidatus Latescibacterota bacterium]
MELPAAKGQRLNVLGFFNTDNDLTPFCVEGSVTTDIVIGCFDLFCQTITRKTMVIIDNAPFIPVKHFRKKGLPGRRRAWPSIIYPATHRNSISSKSCGVLSSMGGCLFRPISISRRWWRRWKTF